MKIFLYFLSVIIFINPHLARADDGFKHGISVFGDLKYAPNFKHFDYANPHAPKGGEVVLGAEGTFNSLNPFILKGISVAGIDGIYDSLMEGSEDEISAKYGLIADAVKLADDKMSIAFKLNKQAHWHDGKKITADDVIFTFNTMLNDAHPVYSMIYSQVKEVQKINDYEVKFLFKNNKNRDLPLLIAGMKILPKHYYQNHKFNETNMQPPLGSGPYKIKEVEQGKRIVYERVSNYWAKDLPVNKGRYNFDKISYDYYRDANVLIEAFKAGKFDFRQENIARNWNNSYNIDKVKNGEIVKKEIINDLPMPAQAFVLNLRRSKFKNLALRKAMNYAFNFEWLNKHIFYSSYKRTESYFQNSEFSYNADHSSGSASVKAAFQLPKGDENDFGRKNLIIAKKILDDAGYKIVGGHLYSAAGEKIKIEILIDSASFQMVVAPFVKNLQKLGIDAKMRLIEENQYAARVRNFDFDVIVAVFGQSLIPGNELLRYWHSSQRDIVGSQNLSGLADKNIDGILEKISAAQNKKELVQLCKKLDYELLSNYHTILQWHNNTYRILYRNIFAMPQKTPKYSLGFDFGWVDLKANQ